MRNRKKKIEAQKEKMKSGIIQLFKKTLINRKGKIESKSTIKILGNPFNLNKVKSVSIKNYYSNNLEIKRKNRYIQNWIENIPRKKQGKLQ